eukprot:scaffold15408_cov41-Cyclotella_meneghiniana.AAC.13
MSVCTPRLPYMEPGQIMHLRDRLRELEGSIVIEDIWYPTLQREGDASIMEKLAQLPGVSKRELEHANQCRKYIRVITIAEMTSLCGRYIPPNRLNGRWRARSSLKWARQPPPTGPMWDKFRQLIKRAFCFKKRHTRIDQQVPIDNPLGKWYNNARRHISYDAYRTKRILFVQQQGYSPICYDRYVTNEERNYLVKEGISLKLPPDAHPVTTTVSRNGNLIRSRTDNDEKEVSGSNLDILLNAEVLITFSDGSYDPITAKAAFNWRIVTDSELGLTECRAPVNTNPKYLDSYRAEYAGIQSLVNYLKTRGLRQKEITVYCDSKSCVDELNKDYDPSITDLEKPERFKALNFAWVKGHQDDNGATAITSTIEHCMRYNAAKECMGNCIKPKKRA